MRKGFTLIEIIITVGLFAIVITLAVGGFINATNTQRQVSSLIATQSNVSLALEQVARAIRTGYLFCNVKGNTVAGVGIAGQSASHALPDCGCTFSSPPAAPGAWTCNALDFYDASGDELLYKLHNGALAEDIDTTSTLKLQSVTGNTVSVKYLKFQLYGQTEADHWPPRVTISIGVSPSSTDPAVSNNVFNLETTVSGREIDCTAAGEC
jgi:prepilin-type N-terminal cleavage/methylation domain-containing protein